MLALVQLRTTVRDPKKSEIVEIGLVRLSPPNLEQMSEMRLRVKSHEVGCAATGPRETGAYGQKSERAHLVAYVVREIDTDVANRVRPQLERRRSSPAASRHLSCNSAHGCAPTLADRNSTPKLGACPTSASASVGEFGTASSRGDLGRELGTDLLDEDVAERPPEVLVRRRRADQHRALLKALRRDSERRPQRKLHVGQPNRPARAGRAVRVEAITPSLGHRAKGLAAPLCPTDGFVRRSWRSESGQNWLSGGPGLAQGEPFRIRP
jgi:hypothetical protein